MINGMVYTYTLDGTKILREDRGSSDILIPLYDNEDIAYEMKTALGKSMKKKLTVYFLVGSKKNQVKITDYLSKKKFSVFTTIYNTIGELVGYAKQSGVRIWSRPVKGGYCY